MPTSISSSVKSPISPPKHSKYSQLLDKSLTRESTFSNSKTRYPAQKHYNLASPPVVEHDDDDSSICFCRVSAQERIALLTKLSFRRTLIRLTMPALKYFDKHSRHPTLGIDATMPQHRLNNTETVIRPNQDEYPVWYFFYGSLADRSVLGRVLNVAEDTLTLCPTSIEGGVLGNWGEGKYRALLDGPTEAVVEGAGFEVESKEWEDSLRAYETDAYEVVRCSMKLQTLDEWVPACVFRFVGECQRDNTWELKHQCGFEYSSNVQAKIF